MTALLIIAAAIAIWHVGMLNGVALYAGSLAARGWIAPTAIVGSKTHKLASLSAAVGALIIWLSLLIGSLGYGLIIGGAFVLADGWLTYRACIGWMRSR